MREIALSSLLIAVLRQKVDAFWEQLLVFMNNLTKKVTDTLDLVRN